MIDRLLHGGRLTAALGVVTAFTAGSTVLAQRFPTPGGRRLVSAASGASAALVALGWWAHVIEPRLTPTAHTKVEWTGPPMRIVFLSDVHLAADDRQRVADVVHRTLELAPDLVLFSGDAIDATDPGPTRRTALEALGALRGRVPLGLFAVLGEPVGAPADDRRQVREQLERAGFRILDDERAELRGGVHLLGIGDRGSSGADAGSLDAIAAGRPTIALARHARTIPPSGFSLAFAADTHGDVPARAFARPSIHLVEALPAT